MPGFRTSSSAALLAAALTAGCLGAETPPDQATPGRNGRGEFFRWDTIDDPAVQTLAPLAVGTAAFVGHSSGGCVESLGRDLASSDCGRLRGRAPGTILLAAFDGRSRLIDWVPLDVAVPTGFVLHIAPAGTVRPGALLVLPFRTPADIVLELQADGRALMGHASWNATVEPAGALRVGGYGRYLRVDCLWTGFAELTIRESTTGVAQTLRVDCLDPPAEGDAAP
jgi:hypothetical protein